jgi:5-methylcytosine-specific restriction endonuclease McrA
MATRGDTSDLLAELRRQVGLEPQQLTPSSIYTKRPKSRGILKSIRAKVFNRDNYTCQICGRRYPEEHLVPNHIDHNIRNNKISNLETVCAGCNMQEGQIYAELLRKAGPRSAIPEEDRLQIAREARRLVKEKVPRKGWRKMF